VRVVKAFNTTGYENMLDPRYGGEPTLMPYAGDDAAAKQVVHELATGLGFDAVDAGALARSRELEHVAVLWIAWAIGIGVNGMGRGIALKLARR
jgi:predicted dinucleotide-binding enzyme